MDQRYSRQMLFSHIGEEGQKKLHDSKVLIVGMGALGTVLANHMVRAGVGYVRFADRDYVEYSNLQRQMLFDEKDASESVPKAVAAQRKLQQVNSSVKIEGIVTDVTAMNIDELASGVDLILDGTDNFQTRFLLNDYCYKNGLPFVYGGAVSSRGMQATFIPEETPCLRCFINEGSSSETCDTSGVIAPIVDIVASYQAIDAMKFLVGKKDAIRKSLLSIDVWHNLNHQMKWTKPKADCLTCGEKVYPSLNVENEDQFLSLCGRETVQISPKSIKERDLDEWASRLSKIGDVQKTPFLVRCEVDDLRLVLFTDGRVLIQGTDDISKAKNTYTKYIGM
ncbi:ThiF family adenylyltransferase [Alkalihalobacterium alkalinitrilicum]|uniref:ThiF family adenylyltransferase n=1 Tax=Alkalihalobacterium alkalinitrilicum TaxID=427920 RepID=UPI000995A801|nr:ThiF family adenylyltransferase [Alkalihalobacterium alkalinitrilicum]